MTTNHRLFGILLCHLNLITPVDNYCILYKYNKLLDIKEFLLSRNLPEQSLSQVYKAAEKNDIPVITSLIRSRILSADTLQKALFHLYHIPFRSIRASMYDGKKTGPLKQVISENSARRNKIIPLVMKDHIFVSGITSPRNLLYIQHLNKKHPQYRFKPVFIPFFDFTRLFKILYPPTNTRGTCCSETSQSRFSHPPDLSFSENNDFFSLPEDRNPALSETRNPALSETRDMALRDMALLMNFKIIVKNPKTDFSKISALYNRYEKLQNLISPDIPQGNSPDTSQDRLVLFKEFILESHRQLARTFKCPFIEFSLKQEQSKILISARPKREIQ